MCSHAAPRRDLLGGAVVLCGTPQMQMQPQIEPSCAIKGCVGGILEPLRAHGQARDYNSGVQGRGLWLPALTAVVGSCESQQL